MSEQHLIFGGMVFVAVFLLMMGLTIPVFGESQKARRNLKKSIGTVGRYRCEYHYAVTEEKYLRSLSPAERWLESLPGMESLGMHWKKQITDTVLIRWCWALRY